MRTEIQKLFHQRLDSYIETLAYDLKVLIYKIFVLNNPKTIFGIYFSKQNLTIKKEIDYFSFDLGTYQREREYYSLYNFILYYELFKKKFRDKAIFYKNVDEEKDRFFYNMSDFIDVCKEMVSEKYNSYYKRSLYFDGSPDYTLKDVIKIDLHRCDMYNEIWDYNGNIAQIVHNLDFNIRTYIENCYTEYMPFDILYRF